MSLGHHRIARFVGRLLLLLLAGVRELLVLIHPIDGQIRERNLR